MGNHFRTPGDAQTDVQAPVADAPAVQDAVPASDAQDRLFARPVSDQTMADSASAPQPLHAAPAHQANPLINVPSPDAPAANPGTGVFVPPVVDPLEPTAETFRTSGGDAGTNNDVDQARQVADLDAALANPDFTTVFAPIEDDRARQAREAGIEPVILMEHVTKVYPAQPNKPALNDVNLKIYPGEFVFLVGHSGSGKTTLLNTMLRNVKPTSGRILVAGQDLMKIKNRKIPFLRRQIGAVFQDYKLLPNRTAYENVAFALQCIGKPRGVIRAQVPEVLRLVGLGDQMDLSLIHI